MRRMQVAVMALSVTLAVNSKAQDHTPLKLVATIPLRSTMATLITSLQMSMDTGSS